MKQYTEEAKNENNCNVEDKLPVEIYCSDDSSCNRFDWNICLDSVHFVDVELACAEAANVFFIFKKINLDIFILFSCVFLILRHVADGLSWFLIIELFISSENEDLRIQQRCPVCKAELSKETLILIFEGDQTIKTSKHKVPILGIIIPIRPFGLASGFRSLRSSFRSSTPSPTQQIYDHGYLHNLSQIYYSDQPKTTTTNMYDPVIGMFGEMIYERVFGNSITIIYSYLGSYKIAGSTGPGMRRHSLEVDKSLTRICLFLFCCGFVFFLSF
ncbi:hypothetical protein MANES_12G100296v8 [Manihot esculenta]|uniref:Uncharacterized protein n=1 Tax=Manihot esculenta TaxID=3983 RepID=A0ACB7GRI5_MANES|nr:hypothetical protein MANES_12G100296v8 [Manihot esculenta]